MVTLLLWQVAGHIQLRCPATWGQVLHALCNRVLKETGFRFVHPDFTVLDHGESQADFETGGNG